MEFLSAGIKARLLRHGWLVEQATPRNSLPKLLAVLFRHYGVNLVVDVGANTGQYAAMIGAAGYRGHIASFEPVGEVFAELQRAAARDPLWTPYRLALGDRDEEREIAVAQSWALSSFRAPTGKATAFADFVRADRAELVEVRRLDGIFEEVCRGVERPVVYLKMDTQGWDLEVLRGAEGCLHLVTGLQPEAAVNPLYEGVPTLSDVIPTVTHLGFEVSGLFPIGWHSWLRVSEVDFVFVRPKAG